MIQITKDIPNIYERVAIEEYYKYFQNAANEKMLFNYDIHFTSDFSKLSSKDLKNRSLLKAIKLTKGEERYSFFVLCFNEEQILQAIAKITLKKDSIDLSHIIFTNYPDSLEKIQILCELTGYVEDLTERHKQKKVNILIFDKDSDAIKLVKTLGYEECENTFTKNLGKRELNEQTLSCLQRKRPNK